MDKASRKSISTVVFLNDLGFTFFLGVLGALAVKVAFFNRILNTQFGGAHV